MRSESDGSFSPSPRTSSIIRGMSRSDVVVLALLLGAAIAGTAWFVADAGRIAYTSAVVTPIERVAAGAGR